MIGNKIADKITGIASPKDVSVSKNSNKKLPEEGVEINSHRKRYIPPEERQQIIDELRLIPKKDIDF